MKELRTSLALSLASCGIGLGDSFSDFHEAITFILGHDVFTHELAEMRPWQEAARIIAMQSVALGRYGDRLRDNPSQWAEILAECRAEMGDTVLLRSGGLDRTEHPVESLQRIAPDKPIVVLEIDDK